MVSREKIYQEYVNTEFWKVGIRPHTLSKRHLRLTNQNIFASIKDNHSSNHCIQLKYVIEVLIKRGRLVEYVKGGN